MTITSTSFKQKFPTFQFLNCDIGFEASLGENEDPLEALKKLKTISEAFHKQEFPHLYESVSFHVTPEPSRISNQELDAAKTEPCEQTIQAFYKILETKNASLKYLELQREAIEKLNDQPLIDAFNQKIKSLQ